MSQDVFAQKSSAATPENRDERAQRAVKAFRGMQPGLTGFAKSLTGRNDVQVVLDVGAPHTDGKKIYYKPPIALGDLTPHERRVCDRRDKRTKLQLCSACRVREEVVISVIHEIAHIAFGTFEKTSAAARLEALERAINEVGTKWAKDMRANWEKIPDIKKDDYLNLSSLISPYLPLLVNGLEDARVDEAMFNARKGTRVMFDAYIQTVFADGIAQDDGTSEEWRNRPLNSQAIIGTFVLAAGYTYEGWFAPEVEEALGDKTLRDLCKRVGSLRSAAGTYELSFPILARLRELGFCRLPDDPEDEPVEEPETEPEPEEEPDESADNEEEVDEGAGDQESDEYSDDDGPTMPGDGDAESDDPQEGKEVGNNPGQPQEEDSGESEEDSGGEGSGSGAEPGDQEPEHDGSGSEPGPGDDSERPAAEGAPGEEAGESESDDSGSVDGDVRDPESDDRDDPSGSEGDQGPEDASPEASGGESEADQGSRGGGTPGSEGPDGDEGEPEGTEASGDGEASDDGPDHSGGPGEPADELCGEDDGSAPSDDGGRGDSEGDGPGAEDGGERGDASSEPRSSDQEGGKEDGPPEAETDAAGPEQGSGKLDLPNDDSDEAVDSGADEGKGGTTVRDHPNYGSSDDAIEDVQVFGQHDLTMIQPDPEEQKADDEALDLAIVQGQYFEQPSANIAGVREHKYGQETVDRDGNAWTKAWDHNYPEQLRRKLGIDSDLVVDESVLGPALVQMRKTFSENARHNMQRHLKSGRVNGRVLGKRAWNGDDRLFQKKRLPGKRSYAVLIGIDISGSTVGRNLALAKRAAMAQAELCDRTGIDFAIYAHTANGSFFSEGGQFYYANLTLDMYEIKAFGQPWDAKAREALGAISSDSENLDGHGVEYYRRLIEKHPATDKVILYYTDGKMPAANHDEELEILIREINTCKREAITLCGVGIRTDSPRRHGLDTVQVNTDEDLIKVVRHLESVLLHNR